MSRNELDVLVRKINPDKFSATAHGPGHHIVYTVGPTNAPEEGSARIFEPGLFKNLFGRRNEVHYFIKRFDTPLMVSSWTYRWSEGTSAISLDFDATFEIMANEPGQARSLVTALNHAENAGTALHGLINRRLHEALTREFRDCVREKKSVLGRFRNSEVGIGESESLNEEVSRAVSTDLGNVPFRIGFRLKNAPPMQVEVQKSENFTLADSETPRKVVTVALLELENYQIYKKAAVETEAAIREAVSGSITQAVRSLLFAKKYYSIVESFSDSKRSIQAQMRSQIEAETRKIGYGLKMFQTYPDIAALALLDSIRIDIDSRDSADTAGADFSKYYPKESTGYVQMEISLSVKASNFSHLHRLISPDVMDVKKPIVDRVRQICQDEIQKINRKEFNLNFQDGIVPTLTTAIVKGLTLYGLNTEIIKINQIATEEAARFKAICGQTTGFCASISPHADRGRADSVQVEGKIEVTGITAGGWEKFESKDFGFRRDSSWSETNLRQKAEEHGIAVGTTSPLPEAERRSVATALELAEIRDRVISTLRERMSKLSDLASEWSTLKTSEQINAWAEKLAGDAISDEFGLSIKLRGFGRSDTAIEITHAAMRASQNQLLVGAATIDKDFELAKRQSEGEKYNKLREEVHRRDELLIAEGSSEVLDRISETLKQDRESFGNNRVALQSAQDMVTPKSKAPQRLPWENDPGGPANQQEKLG